MSSKKNSRKIVRTESLINEYSIYFSHLFSPSKKINNPENPPQQQITYGGGQVMEDGDVDAEAEDFIKKKHRKFQLSKWLSRKFA